MDYQNKWFAYIKPTRRKHESGYRMFEVGYIRHDESEKVVLGSCTDHIWNMRMLGQRFNIDLLNNGCIRFHADQGVMWDNNEWAVSTMGLEAGWVSDGIIEKLKSKQNHDV